MPKYFAANAPLAPHTSYNIGGNAKYLCRAYDCDGLLRALELSPNRLILGRGSKVLVSDKGFDGVAILMRSSRILPLKNAVYAEAGVSLPALSRYFALNGLKGLEWAVGLPASVGGAVKMNAGAFGGDISGVVCFVDVLRDGQIKKLLPLECAFGYRTSCFGCNDIVLGAAFRLEGGDKDKISGLMAEYRQKRLAAQPTGLTCGSVFKGLADPAWKYIDRCGLRGLACGGAEISLKHANFIINKGFAKAKDVFTLIRAIKAEVFIKEGVRLMEEVVYAGEF